MWQTFHIIPSAFPGSLGPYVPQGKMYTGGVHFFTHSYEYLNQIPKSTLYNESKNIENRRVLFAGDDFEKYVWTFLVDIVICIGNPMKMNWLSLVFQWNVSKTNEFSSIFNRNIFLNHLQQKVLDGFQCFLIQCKAEIVSSHEHLESFNSTDSSLRYRSKHCACHH